MVNAKNSRFKVVVGRAPGKWTLLGHVLVLRLPLASIPQIMLMIYLLPYHTQGFVFPPACLGGRPTPFSGACIGELPFSLLLIQLFQSYAVLMMLLLLETDVVAETESQNSCD